MSLLSRLPFLLLALLIVILAAATFVEHFYGTAFAHSYIYKEFLFVGLWGGILLSGAASYLLSRKKTKRSLSSDAIHFGLIVILIGAAVSFFTAKEGELPLRQGITERAYLPKDGDGLLVRLPFSIELDSFSVITHAGEEIPADYIGHLHINETPRLVKPNHPVSEDGIRLTLQSFDSRNSAVRLSVRNDPWGRPLTFAGYILLGVGLVARFLRRLRLKEKSFKNALLSLSVALLVILACEGLIRLFSPNVPLAAGDLFRSLTPLLRPIALVLLLSGLTCSLPVVSHAPSNRVLRISCDVIQACSFVILTFYLLLFIHATGRLPLGNGSETMWSAAWLSFPFGLWLRRTAGRSLSAGLSALAGATFLLVSTFGSDNAPQRTLAPVLNSPLLAFHVSTVITAYTLLTLTFFLSIYALIDRKEAHRLRSYSLTILRPAVALLTIGIFLGAVWGDAAWGRYWGWDAKEVWALITLLVYILPLHVSLHGRLRRAESYHRFMAAAFLTVLMTYFGAGLFFGGLHSYA